MEMPLCAASSPPRSYGERYTSLTNHMHFNKKEPTGPRQISDLFAKYKRTLKAPQGTVVTTAVEVIYDLVGVEIPKERVTYKPHTKILSVRVAGPLKTEIQLRKQEILAHIRGRLGSQNVPTEIL